MKTIALLALLLGTAVAGNAMADSLNVCINKKTGVLRSARNCNAKETRSLIALESAGTNGAIGPAGAKGETGPQGPSGAAGAAGAAGKSLLNGTAAPTTAVGVVGDFYMDTTNKRLYGPKTLADWPTAFLSVVGPAGDNGATGPQGPAGAAGKSLLNGTAAPTTAVGVVGDFYMDTTNKRLYGPKTLTDWPTAFLSVVGPAGDNGATGPQGPAGVMGQKGETGPQGPAGIAGQKGEVGPQGVAGAGATVFDANGQKLGILLSGGSSYVSVYDKSTNLLANLRPDPVDPTILRTDTWNTKSYAYASTDCSGNPLRVFHVSGNGTIRPNGLGFSGERDIFNIIYAEATTAETIQQDEVLSGTYLTLGDQVSKQVNETDTSVLATSVSLIRSVKGDSVDNPSGPIYWYRKPNGCTQLVDTPPPTPPLTMYDTNSQEWRATYKGISYGSDLDSAFKEYYLDEYKSSLYTENNRIEPKFTRWVFTYATTSAPFPSLVKLPLSFQ